MSAHNWKYDAGSGLWGCADCGASDFAPSSFPGPCLAMAPTPAPSPGLFNIPPLNGLEAIGWFVDDPFEPAPPACVRCSTALSPELDAYYGRDEYAAKHCTKCRPRYAQHA